MATNIKNPHVIDASAILNFIMPDEKTNPIISKIFKAYQQNKNTLVAPRLILYEVANALNSAIIRKRTTFPIAQKILQKFSKLPILYLEINELKTLTLANQNQISFYDASYLHLSQKLKCPLITLDKKLAKLSHV
jgi:predicted nucleic acid-binding protein